MGILDTVLGVIKSQVANNAAPGAAPGGADHNLLESVIGMISRAAYQV